MKWRGEFPVERLLAQGERRQSFTHTLQNDSDVGEFFVSVHGFLHDTLHLSCTRLATLFRQLLTGFVQHRRAAGANDQDFVNGFVGDIEALSIEWSLLELNEHWSVPLNSFEEKSAIKFPMESSKPTV